MEMMDPQRDFPNFTDAALIYFIRRFPSHPDHVVAVAELERRRQGRKQQQAEPAREKARPVGSGLLIWSIAGIVTLALLIPALAILTPRTRREPHPISFSELFTPMHKLEPSAKGPIRGALPPKPSATETPAPPSPQN